MKSSLFISLLIPATIFIAAGPKHTHHRSPEPVVSSEMIVTKGGTVEFTDANFQSKVLSSDKLTVVDFWAPWCGPCRAMGPVVDELAKDYDGKVNIGKLNVDNNPNICGKYNITSIPTLLFIKGGKVVDKLVGVYPKDKLQKKIKAHL